MVGMLAIVGIFFIYTTQGSDIHPLVITLIAVIALINPEVISELPFGPTK
jgi:hypothetical protein